MGLDISHDAWDGAYSAFMRWREKIVEISEMPPLGLMEGYFKRDDFTDPFQHMVRAGLEHLAEGFYRSLPIRWESLKPDPLHVLLYHSDSEGELTPEECAAIAARLEELLPLFPDEDAGGHIGNWRQKTQQFIDGARAAAEANEPLEFS